MVFVGPCPESITEMGQKHRARDLAVEADAPVVPGTGLLESESSALDAAQKLGFPVMLKATGGGGGMGLQVCNSEGEISTAFRTVKSRGESLFKNAGVFLEKYFPESRHIEVQIFGNGTDVVHFGERECSIQRRHQKIIEECPSPFVQKSPGLREKLTKCATAYALQLKYKSAGTIEFLVDDNTGDFFFLEMNTRLQVEHGITELCYGIDLVAFMLQQADYEKGGQTGLDSAYLRSLQRDGPNGAAVEARVYAEVPFRNYAPSPGLLQAVEWPQGDGIRVDTWVKTGQRIASFYDPLIAKVMVHSNDRSGTIKTMTRVLSTTKLQGPLTNLSFLRDIISSASFTEGDTLTNFLSTKFKYQPCAIEVLSPGSFTTVQDFPARATSGHGIPKGGPMDNVSSIANILVGNEPSTETLEITISGPELLFTAPAVIALSGAPVSLYVDGEETSMWSRLFIQGGQKLVIGRVEKGGCRCYLAVKGGFPDIPTYLGSKSATPSLAFGGTQGRQLQRGDFIELNPSTRSWAESSKPYTLSASCIPDYNIDSAYCMHGPHDSADFMTPSDLKMLYSNAWKIGHNSNRTGVRLVGPKPEWSRPDGGEGGSHPSNVFDYGYPSPGGINWGGDSALAFSMDSPDLGGLLCSTTVISADLWRLGQVKPGGTLRLVPTTYGHAIELNNRVEAFIKDVSSLVDGSPAAVPFLNLELPPSGIPKGESNAIIKDIPAEAERFRVVYRQGGDNFVLIEIGKQTCDVRVTSRIRLLVEKLEALNLGLVMNPNIGSVMVQFSPETISQKDLVKRVIEIESALPPSTDTNIHIPCREISLPVVFDHPAIAASTQRYIETNRPTAAYLPDNVEYLRSNNGLSSRRATFQTLLNSQYLVVAVGFLVGTPILFPLNPMSGIVGQKYNPTRVSTPGGTIGMGGSLFAIYPLEAPGGYMLFARTMECWDTFGSGPSFELTRPWLFEPFDVVKYHEVSVEEYDKLMLDYRRGMYKFDIKEGVFDLHSVHERFEQAKTDTAVGKFREGQKKGVGENLEKEKKMYSEWVAAQEAERGEEEKRVKHMMREPKITIDSPIDANVWKVLVEPGVVLEEGMIVAILEAMKMEINIVCTEEAVGAIVEAIASKPGMVVSPGAWIVVAKRDKGKE